jgi:hypothetical protein
MTQDHLASEISKGWQIMAWITSTIALLALGVGTLFVAWRGHTSGELVVVRFFRTYRPNREGDPLRFYFHLGILITVGTLEIVWGTLMCVGLLRPLPWR